MLWNPKVYHRVYKSLLLYPNHHPLVLFDEHVFFLLMAFSCGASWSATV